MAKRIPLAAPLLLAGCSVPRQTVDASRAACASYGFQPGSDAFAECVMTEQHRHTLHIALRPHSRAGRARAAGATTAHDGHARASACAATTAAASAAPVLLRGRRI